VLEELADRRDGGLLAREQVVGRPRVDRELLGVAEVPVEDRGGLGAETDALDLVRWETGRGHDLHRSARRGNERAGGDPAVVEPKQPHLELGAGFQADDLEVDLRAPRSGLQDG
jgi:hypothetical protein